MDASRIILGTVQLGLDYGINNILGKPSDAGAYDILNKAYSLGIRTLDTAEGYGNACEVIGNYHRKSGNRFLINSKFKVDGSADLLPGLKNSLKQLEIDFLNVYFFHRYEDLFQYPEVISELKFLKTKNLISKCGISVYDNAQFESAIASDVIDTIQLPLNLLDNWYQRGAFLLAAKARKKEIQIRSVYLQGLLLKDPASFPPILEPLKKYVEVLQKTAYDAGMNMKELAMAYVSSKNEIDQVVVGVDSADQLAVNLELSRKRLSSEIIEKIEQIMVKEVELLYPLNWK
jgi:aryl-alcohol dehydrogenase-like predicted oxidoreductase